MYDTREIKRSISMPDLAERYGVKIRRGMCCCPFHGEKHPSMKIYPDGYYCFACGEHGDIFSWVMKYDSVNFPQAVERICDMYGITPDSKPYEPPEKRRADLLNAYKAACKRVRELQPAAQDEPPSAEFWDAVQERNRLEDIIVL